MLLLLYIYGATGGRVWPWVWWLQRTESEQAAWSAALWTAAAVIAAVLPYWISYFREKEAQRRAQIAKARADRYSKWRQAWKLQPVLNECVSKLQFMKYQVERANHVFAWNEKERDMWELPAKALAEALHDPSVFETRTESDLLNLEHAAHEVNTRVKRMVASMAPNGDVTWEFDGGINLSGLEKVAERLVVQIDRIRIHWSPRGPADRG